MELQTVKFNGSIPQSCKIPENTVVEYNYTNNTNQEKHPKPSKEKTALAVLSGISLGIMAKIPAGIAQMPIINKLFKLADKFKPKSERFLKISENMAKENYLKEKGFEMISADKGLEEILSSKINNYIIDSYLNQKSKFKLKNKTPDQIINEIEKKIEKYSEKLGPMLYKIEKGKNAGFHPGMNVAMTSKQRACFMPHEVGHAINFNNAGSIGKAAHLLIILPFVALPTVLLTSLLHTKKEGNKKSKKEKIKDFIQDHAGTLAFLSFTPQLIEEARASNHALKAVKSSLTKSEFNAYRKMLGSAFCTYLIVALTAGLGMRFGIYAKNKLLEPDKAR